MTASVIGASCKITQVFLAAYRAKIAKPVVRSVAVDVVDLIGPFTVNHHPDNAVGKVSIAPDVDTQVATATRISDRLSRVLRVECAPRGFAAFVAFGEHPAGALFVRQNPRLRIV